MHVLAIFVAAVLLFVVVVVVKYWRKSWKQNRNSSGWTRYYIDENGKMITEGEDD